jgi:hypothetical protein
MAPTGTPKSATNTSLVCFIRPVPDLKTKIVSLATEVLGNGKLLLAIMLDVNIVLKVFVGPPTNPSKVKLGDDTSPVIENVVVDLKLVAVVALPSMLPCKDPTIVSASMLLDRTTFHLLVNEPRSSVSVVAGCIV